MHTMDGFSKLLANAQQFHRVAMPTTPAHALLCINVQSSKVCFPRLQSIVVPGVQSIVKLPSEAITACTF